VCYVLILILSYLQYFSYTVVKITMLVEHHSQFWT